MEIIVLHHNHTKSLECFFLYFVVVVLLFLFVCLSFVYNCLVLDLTFGRGLKKNVFFFC